MFEQFRQIERKKSLAQLFRNLKIAFVAVLAVWFLLNALQLNVLDSVNFRDSNNWFETLTLNVLLLGYPIAAIALWRFRETFIVERFPIWLGISVVGSILAMSLHSFMIQILNDESETLMTRHNPGGFYAFFAMYFATLLSFYVAPITAAFYYSPPIVKVLKQMWRNG